MKLLQSWLLPLLGYSLATGPVPVRVTFSPLTKAAYLAAKKTAVLAKPATTFPLKKVRGRIVIPTAKGRVIFKDNDVSEENLEWEKYAYRGYSSQLECHLIEHSHYERIGSILLDKYGGQIETYDMPIYSPDFKKFATISAGLEDTIYSNSIRFFRRENHHWNQIWELEQATWEPVEIQWLSTSTLLLKKRMWAGKNPGSTYTYSRLSIQ